MKRRMPYENINNLEYLNSVYDTDFREGGKGGYVRLKEELELIDTPYEKILDIGCADGAFIKYYLDKFPESYGFGVDLSDRAIGVAQQDCPVGHFEVGDCYNLPFLDDFFDMVHSAEVLEHLEDLEKAISEMHRVLKPDGILILTTINEKATPYEEHLWTWDLGGVTEMLKGFEVVDSKPEFHNGHILYIKAKKI